MELLTPWVKNYKLQNTNYKQITNYNVRNYKQKINQKFLRGDCISWSVGQWVSSMIGKRSYESLIMMSRPHPETNENQHHRFVQHIGSPRRGAPGPPAKTFNYA
jgi:hypothetical protein